MSHYKSIPLLLGLVAFLQANPATPFVPDRPSLGRQPEVTLVDPEAVKRLRVAFAGSRNEALVTNAKFQFLVHREDQKGFFVIATNTLTFTKEGFVAMKLYDILDFVFIDGKEQSRRGIWSSEEARLEFDRPVQSVDDLLLAKLRVYRHRGQDKTDRFD